MGHGGLVIHRVDGRVVLTLRTNGPGVDPLRIKSLPRGGGTARDHPEPSPSQEVHGLIGGIRPKHASQDEVGFEAGQGGKLSLVVFPREHTAGQGRSFFRGDEAGVQCVGGSVHAPVTWPPPLASKRIHIPLANMTRLVSPESP